MKEISDETAAMCANVKQLYFSMQKKSVGQWPGIYQSYFHSGREEMKDIKEYQIGDDPRFIDWNVTAKLNKHYVRTYHMTAAVTLFLLIDVSATMAFGSKTASKKEIAAQIFALFSFVALKQSDRVGCILFAKQIYRYFPPIKNTKHIEQIIEEILHMPKFHESSNLETAIDYLHAKHKGCAVCLILTDGLHAPCTEKKWRLLSSLYETHLFCLTDPMQWHIPPVGLLQIQALDSEQSILIDTDDPLVNHYLYKHTQESLEKYKKILQRSKIECLFISIDQPIVLLLIHYFSKKK